MTTIIDKIGVGGGCHWCTEAVFQMIMGVMKVEQGFIASTGENNTYSEAVIVYFDPQIISLFSLIKIHLHTHSCTSNHNLRTRYRSAIYIFNSTQENMAKRSIQQLQEEFRDEIITKVLPFNSFQDSPVIYKDYYKQDPDKPFCKTYITPKIKYLNREFRNITDPTIFNES